jgi:putative ABC transport system permease protein
VGQQFASLEADTIKLLAQPDYRGTIPAQEGQLSDDDLTAIMRLPNVREVVGRYSQSGELRAGSSTTYAQIIGAQPNQLRPDKTLVLGRYLSDADIAERARVAVLDWNLAQVLYPDGRPLGRELQIMGLNFRVIGVLSPVLDALGANDAVTVPLSTARDRLFPMSALSRVQINEATIYLNDSRLISVSEQHIAALLRERHKLMPEQGNDFIFENSREFAEANTRIMAGITAFLGLIGSIALLVGGIGITNMMLVSVTERTREIGLRKAVGARQHDILFQFLVEAVVLSLIGGLGGIFFTAVLIQVSAIVAQTLGQTALAQVITIDASSVVLALIFASVVGLIAGIYPAYQASRLTPIAALRNE